ncbi:MAG: ABC transporter permease [Cyclobacteriaceae bacterium]
MNLAFFISSRITRKSDKSFSSNIHKVAVISIGTAICALLLSFMILGGFQDKIKDKIFSFSGHLLVTKYAMNSSFEESEISISDSLTWQLNNARFVTNWQPFAYKAGLLKTKEEVQGVIFKGVGEDFDTTSFKPNIIAGAIPDLYGKQYSTEVAVSKKIAQTLRLDIGDKVMIYFVQNPPRFRNLTITGIYETGLQDFDERIILGDIGLVRRLNDWDERQAGGIEVFVKDNYDIDQAHAELFDLIDYDLYVESVREKYLEHFDWLSMINTNVAVLLILILFISCFNMVSILLILIMERTQMIGMLKAMGAQDGMIRKIFISSGLRLILSGLGWGNLIGLLIAFVQWQFELIPLDQENYYMHFVPIAFNWQIVVGLNALMVLMIGLSLFIPVAFVTRVQPIKAIRFD